MAEGGGGRTDLQSLLDFRGKTALVTGVLDAQSIAWPIASRLNDGGARLAISIQRKAVRRLIGDLFDRLRDPVVVECDVSDDAAVERMYAQVGQALGHLDFLVHSIAYAPPRSFEKPFVETMRDDFMTALDVSAYSLIALARGALPFMRERGGCILTLTYLAGERVIPGYKLMSVAKAALENIVKNLAYELAPYRIRVNALSPGPVATKAGTSIPGFALMHSHFRETNPLQTDIQNTDVGNAALFLLSPMAEKITGEIIHIDGGYHVLGMAVKPKAGQA